LPFETVVGVWNFSPVLQNVCFHKNKHFATLDWSFKTYDMHMQFYTDKRHLYYENKHFATLDWRFKTYDMHMQFYTDKGHLIYENKHFATLDWSFKTYDMHIQFYRHKTFKSSVAKCLFS
jgi:hypothetical protein